jgi:hypothetical protein
MKQPYVPNQVVNPDGLMTSLFVNHARHHYYFGNYFEDQHQKGGFVPWLDYRPTRHTQDHNFTYYRQSQADRNWETGLRDLYAGRRRGDIPRPPVTLSQQNAAIKKLSAGKTADAKVARDLNLTHQQNVTMLTPLKSMHKAPVSGLAQLIKPRSEPRPGEAPRKVIELAKVSKDQREQLLKGAAQVRQVARERGEAEARLLAQGTAPHKPTDPPRVVKLNLPQPPATVKPPARQPPPPPIMPKHEEKAIPKYEPPKQPKPPPKP